MSPTYTLFHIFQIYIAFSLFVQPCFVANTFCVRIFCFVIVLGVNKYLMLLIIIHFKVECIFFTKKKKKELLKKSKRYNLNYRTILHALKRRNNITLKPIYCNIELIIFYVILASMEITSS